MGSLMWQRDVTSSISDAKSSFSSWDKCMDKAYCKWPVIIAIVIVSLIVLSVVSCVVRCCCCGLECCCGCFRCFNACCPSPRKRKGHKNLDSNTPPNYQNQNYPQYGGAVPVGAAAAVPSAAPYRAPAPMKYDNTPQFATFDVSKNNKVDDDALPAMPSWENAQSRKVEVEEPAPKPADEKDGVELQQLYENPSPPGGRSPGLLPGQQMPNAAGAFPRRPSPGAPSPTGGSYNPTISGVSAPESHVSSDVSGRTDYYNQAQNAGYGAGAVGAAAGYRRPSPGPGQGFQPGRSYQQGNRGYNQGGYGQGGYNQGGYSQPPRQPSPPQPAYNQQPQSAYQQPAYQKPQYQAYNSSQQSFGVTGGNTSPTSYQQGGQGYNGSSGPQPAATTLEEPQSYIGVGRRPVENTWRDI